MATLNNEEKIKEELLQIATFYGSEHTEFTQQLLQLPLNHYVEIVLAEYHFELLIGGVGQEQALISLAESHHFPPEIVYAFQACVQTFPDKMLYTKFCPPNEKEAGSMYLVLLEPWEKVWAFLLTLGFEENVLDEVKEKVVNTELCFLLGFSYDKQAGALSVKTYHSFDRLTSNEPEKPFLVSYRLSKNGLKTHPKRYWADAKWTQENVSERWAEVNQFATDMFGETYGILKGVAENGSIKKYVLRYDVRENEVYSLKTYNYYTEEGTRLVLLGNFEAGAYSFQNAIDYRPNDAEAYHKLGYTFMMQEKYVEGIDCVLKAKSLQPHLSNLIWSWSRPLTNQDEEIQAASREIEAQPSATLYNTRGILRFHKREYTAAKQDFLTAISLNPLHADAYNNLGGTCIKLGEFVDAVKYCTTALSIDTQGNSSNLSIARDAVKYQREATLNPSPNACNLFGKYCYQLDLFELAKEQFQKAEKLNHSLSIA